jgi:5-methylcytosine-specific restriction endonuclease McrA
VSAYGQGGLSAWRRVRKAVLDAAGWRCQARILGVCTGAATMADHITPLSELGIARNDPRALDPRNLQAICPACHDFKTERERIAALARVNKARAAARRKRLSCPEERHPGS